MRGAGSRTFAIRALAASMALAAVSSIRVAHGSPADIFTIAAPIAGSDAPKETPLVDGDASVSTQTGALQYSYPITVPPGRNGTQPHLALTYTSQAPIYGGIAAGWSLSIPIIEQDTSAGRMALALNPSAEKIYKSSMAGDRRLVAVNEPHGSGTVAYRAQNDSTFTRYERSTTGAGFYWRAYSPDGTRYAFGGSGQTGNCPIVNDTYAPLTSITDIQGNQIIFTYETGNLNECRILKIEYGSNENTSAYSDYAAIKFHYAASTPACAGTPIGSQSSYRTGTKIVTGASRLDSIEVDTFPASSATAEHVRMITLAYSSADASCTAQHAAFRSLSSIQESAWHTGDAAVNLPPVAFTYGSATPSYTTSTQTGSWWAASAPLSLAYNLAWGYRFQNNTWPTVEAMMLDVDGDGLVDRVYSTPRAANGSFGADPTNAASCAATWLRNTGAGFDQTERRIDLPTLKWATAQGAPAYSSGAHARSNNTQGLDERCALNYQLTQYVNAQHGAATLCDQAGQMCPSSYPHHCNNGDDCTSSGSPYPTPPDRTYLSYRWFDIDGDGKADLVVSPAGSIERYNLQHGAGFGPPYFSSPIEPTLFGAFPSCPVSWVPDGVHASTDYTMCGNMHPWFVYLNHGSGVFGQPGSIGHNPLPDSIQYEPVALESDVGDSSVYSNPISSKLGDFDIDGDGHADGVLVDPTGWKVARNDGAGWLAPYLNVYGTNEFYSFGHNGNEVISDSSLTGGAFQPIQTEGLVDLNGDGLIDHWAQAWNSTSAVVEWNDSAGFQAQSSPPETVSQRPGTEAGAYVPAVNGFNGTFVLNGFRHDVSRVLDLDDDGRPDAMRCSAVTADGPVPSVSVAFNQGGQFGTLATFASGSSPLTGALAHWNTVRDLGALPSPNTWELRSDMIDIDGDGVLESIDYGRDIANPQHMTLGRADVTHPPRLLYQIDNGRGAKTTVAYASVANSATVQQDLINGKTNPRAQLVVKSIKVDDAMSTTPTSSLTGYAYVNPHVGADDRGRYAMRGFEKVLVTHPNMSVTVERYDYSLDWSGRQISSILQSAGSDSGPRTIDDTTWEARGLFCGTSPPYRCRVTTYHPTTRDHWRCASGETEVTCRSDVAGYVRTESIFTKLASSNTSDTTGLMWKETETRIGANPVYSDGDRNTVDTPYLYSDSSNYRVQTIAETRNLRTAGADVPFRHLANTYIDSYRKLHTTAVQLSSSPTNVAVSRWEYDIAGNVLQHWKPEQNAATSHATVTTYDARGVYAATETDEMGLEVDNTWDYATGVRLTTLGPNSKGCTSHCPIGANYPAKEEKKSVVDGLGREIEHWETFSDDGNVYTLYKNATTSYVDAVVGTTPLCTTTQQLLDTAGTTWIKTKTDLDGHGRPIKKTAYTQGSAPYDAISTFTYSNDGTLVAATVPDPTGNTAATVTFTYTYDTIGRPTGIRRPDAISVDRSGVDISYNGLTKVVQEHVGAAGGIAVTTTTTLDRYERLATVAESTAGLVATTTYGYASDDNISSVTDAEGNVTTLVHDWNGHRTEIHRQARIWKYTYDRNGNAIAEQVPSPNPAIDAAQYTTTIAYDDDDRPLTRSIAPRALSSADLALFGAGTESYTWDSGGANHKGRLRYWRALAPGAPLSNPTLLYDASTDAQGRQTQLALTYTAAGYTNVQRQLGTTHYAFGGTRLTQFYDAVGGTNQTTTQTHYDARGLPSYVDLFRDGEANFAPLVSYSRNVAGFVTKTRKDFTATDPMTYLESNWTYDTLGRVTSQQVQKGPGTDQVVRQSLAYFGNDDVSTLDHWLGNTNHKHFTYSYDMRHQLAGVDETLYPHAFQATYGYGLAGRSTTTTENAASLPGSDVKPRDVTYHYDGVDPEQVTSLTQGASTYASYTYDLAGNQITRSYPGSQDSWDYVYDGKDQLRRATKKHAGVVQGSEEYWYDLNGQRTNIVKRDASGAPTEMVFFNGETESHYDATGVLQKVDSHITLGTPVARIERTGNTSTALEYQFHGLANNTLATVAQNGTINASFTYAPFGELIETTDGGAGANVGVAKHRRRLNDKYADELTDLGYYGRRFYDKTLIGWTQADPSYRFAPDAAWTQPRKANLYQFTLSNPNRYLDPDGRAVAGALLRVAPFVAEIPVADVVVAVVLVISLFTNDTVASSPAPEISLEVSTAGSSENTSIRSTSVAHEPALGGTLSKVTDTKSGASAGTKSEMGSINLPYKGAAGSTATTDTHYDTPKQARRYGKDGYPETDTDYDHDHGCGAPHCHDWKRGPNGEPPRGEDRGPARKPRPDDPHHPDAKPVEDTGGGDGSTPE